MVKRHEKRNIKHKERVPTTFIVILIVVVALLAIGAFFIFSSNKPLDYSQYNGFQFTKIGKNWQTMVEMNGQLYEVPFYNHPYDISGVSYNDNVTKHLMNVINTIKPKREIIIAVSPDSGSVPVLAGVNIARITGKFYGAKTSSALYLNDDKIKSYNNSANLPIVNCGDANFLKTIIHVSINETNESANFVNNNTNCILVGASNSSDLLEVADVVGYKLLGIMK